jgi:hypothetical protein
LPWSLADARLRADRKYEDPDRMEETRATARLPHLDVEILHRRLPESDAELLAISLHATPSFAAFARQFDAQATLWPWLALNPWLGWQQLLEAAWRPWLALAERPASAGAPPPGRAAG